MTETKLRKALDKEAWRLDKKYREERGFGKPRLPVKMPGTAKGKHALLNDRCHRKSFIRGGLFALEVLRAEQKIRKLTE